MKTNCRNLGIEQSNWSLKNDLWGKTGELWLFKLEERKRKQKNTAGIHKSLKKKKKEHNILTLLWQMQQLMSLNSKTENDHQEKVRIIET